MDDDYILDIDYNLICDMSWAEYKKLQLLELPVVTDLFKKGFLKVRVVLLLEIEENKEKRKIVNENDWLILKDFFTYNELKPYARVSVVSGFPSFGFDFSKYFLNFVNKADYDLVVSCTLV